MSTVAPAAFINPAALRHNLDRVRAAAPDSKVMAVVKANAYGHDLPTVAAALTTADALAVARTDEGITLRERGFSRPIVVLEGAANDEEVAACALYRFDLVVHQAAQIDQLERLDNPAGFSVWLKLDTGMNRLGFAADEYPGVLKRLQQLPSVLSPIRLMTHLACADVRSDTLTPRQIQQFSELTGDQAGEISIANSAGLLAWPESRRDWVRPGIMLYGISPFAGQTGPDLGLEPAMHFCTNLMAIKKVRAGDSVGYGATWTANHDTWIGIAATGYGDGYPGNLPSGTPVLVSGRRQSLAGRVSMDMIAIDLGASPAARVGDPVTLWGPGLPVEEIAALAGRLSYELVCGVSRRVPRIVLESQRG